MYYYGVGHKNDYLGSGKYFKRALKIYGPENFNKVILKWFESPKEAFSFEDRFLKIFNLKEDKNSYNLCNNSFGGNTMPSKSTIEYDERIKKMGAATTINNYKIWTARTVEEKKLIGEKISKAKAKHSAKKKAEIYQKYKKSFLDNEEKVKEWKSNSSKSAKLRYTKITNKEKSCIAKKTVESRQKNLDYLSESERKLILSQRHGSAIGKKWYYTYNGNELLEKLAFEPPPGEWFQGRPSTAIKNKLKNKKE